MQLRGLKRRPWRELIHADASVEDELVELLQSLQSAAIQPLIEHSNLAENEIAASPFGLRAVALGAATGARHVHRELTRVPSWRGDARTEDSNHNEWRNGVLQTGKYQAFTQDGAHSIFDPTHIAKWGPHEMMHRACLFFWNPDASGFDLYLGARLNEVLPVALWYGADQVARLDGGDFERHATRRELERADWRDASEDGLRGLAKKSVHNLRWFACYLDRELAAIDEEIQTGRRVETPWAKGGATLNASSDALAYVLAHAPRLRQSAVAAALQSTPAVPSIREYRHHIEAQIEELLFSELRFDEVNVDKADRDGWHQRLAGAIGGQACLEADGVHGLDLGQLADGIEESLPHTFEWLEEQGGDWLEAFADSSAFWRRAPLAERLNDFCQEMVPSSPGSALAKIEGSWLDVREDERIRGLGQEEGTSVVANAEAKRLDFDCDILGILDGEHTNVKSESSMLVVRHHGEVLTLSLDAELRSFWDQLALGPVPYDAALDSVGEQRLASLLHAGAVTRWRAP